MSEFLGSENEKLGNVEDSERVFDPESTQAMGELAVGRFPEEDENPEENPDLELEQDIRKLIFDFFLEDEKNPESKEFLDELDSDGLLGYFCTAMLGQGKDPFTALEEAGITIADIEGGEF